MMTGLLSLKGLVKKYEYEMEEERKPLLDIIKLNFPILGGLVDALLQQHSDLAFEILHIICKIFYLANQLIISPHFNSKEALTPWMGLFKQILDNPLRKCLFTLSGRTKPAH